MSQQNEHRRKILLVDDEKSNLDTLIRLFRRQYHVFSAQSGEDALEILKEQEVVLILTDQHMPGITGAKLLEQAMHTQPDAIRMILSGFTDAEDLIEAINSGQVYRYIVKPWNPDELQQTVDRAVEAHDLTMENRHLLTELRALNTSLERRVEDRTAELKDANEKLEKAVRQAEWGLATVQGLAHNLKNVATGIYRSCDAIIKSNSLLDATKEKVETVRQISAEMAEDFTRLFRATGDPQYKSFSLGAMMDRLIFPIIQNHPVWKTAIQLDKQYENISDITADRGKLEIAFRDLITNACEAMEESGGQLTVRITAQTANVIVEIQDTGKGIPQADLEKVFRPHYTSKAGGTGLGLWIAKQIVEQMHRGELSIHSQEGHGTTVEICLPTSLESD